MRIPYIAGTATVRNSARVRCHFEHRRIPTMYVPAYAKATVDFTEFYERAPHDMSRYELEEIQEQLRLEEQGIYDIYNDELLAHFGVTKEEADQMDKVELMKKTQYFQKVKEHMRNILPLRMGVFKGYWKKYRNNKKKRELLVEMFDEQDIQVRAFFDDEIPSWRDQIEGAREFLEEIRQKELLGLIEEEQQSERAKKLKFEQLEYTVDTFNPLDAKYTIEQQRIGRKIIYEKTPSPLNNRLTSEDDTVTTSDLSDSSAAQTLSSEEQATGPFARDILGRSTPKAGGAK